MADPARKRADAASEFRVLVGQNKESLDPLVHERMRLSILSALSVNESSSFAELKTLLNATDGNLLVHVRKLEEARFVKSTKSKSQTLYRLTAAGKRAFQKYLEYMEALIDAVKPE